MIERSMQWYEEFACTGGNCPYNCCRSEWRIPILEEEYQGFQGIEGDIREEVLGSIEGEPGKRVWKRQDGHCAMLTEDGWCRLVQHCGAEKLNSVCREFPRTVNDWGDIRERHVEIACPVVAQRLLTDAEFVIGETESEEAGESKLAYTILTYPRDFLIDLMGTCPGEYLYGKAFLLYTLRDMLCREIVGGSLSAAKTEMITDSLRSEEMIEQVFLQDAELCQNASRRLTAAINVLSIEDTIGFDRASDPAFPDARGWEYLKGLLKDRERLSEELSAWTEEIGKTYPCLMENYLSYIIFLDFIQADLKRFGERLLTRAFEYSLFLLLALAQDRVYGAITAERFAVLISWADRMVVHNQHLPGFLKGILEKTGASDGAGILKILL